MRIAERQFFLDIIVVRSLTQACTDLADFQDLRFRDEFSNKKWSETSRINYFLAGFLASLLEASGVSVDLGLLGMFLVVPRHASGTSGSLCHNVGLDLFWNTLEVVWLF